jgi:hypothetical protein
MKRLLTSLFRIIVFIFVSSPTYSQTNSNSVSQVDTLVIKKDTLLIESPSKFGVSKCKGQLENITIYFAGKTNKESNYTYCIGSSSLPKNNELPLLSVILLKSDSIASIINLNEHFSPSHNIHIFNPINISIPLIDEIIELNMNQEFCGGYNGSIFLIREHNNLIKGPSITQYGEPGTEFFYQNIVQQDEMDKKELWIKTSVGKSAKRENFLYFERIDKYQIGKDSLIHLNPNIPIPLYVTSISGLTQRSEPSIHGINLGKIPFKAQVNVLNKTNIETIIDDDSKKIKGNWVQIEYTGEQLYDYSFFVFDGYLSEIEPK